MEYKQKMSKNTAVKSMSFMVNNPGIEFWLCHLLALSSEFSISELGFPHS